MAHATPTGECEWAAALPDLDLTAELQTRADLPESLWRTARRVAARSPLPVRAAVVAAIEAWSAAGLIQSPAAADRVGVVVAGNNLNGRYASQLATAYRHTPQYLPPRAALHLQDTDHVGVLSHLLDIRGEGMTVGGASAAGNVALVTGARLVGWGVLDACLVVGAMCDLSPLERQAYRGLGAMCQWVPGAVTAGAPFDADHAGFVYGQAAGAVVLESPGSARRRGTPVRARLAGYDVRLAANSFADPSEDQEVEVVRAAMSRARIGPGDVQYVNTHGTASPLGDRVEARALRRALGPSAGEPWVNATKALTGHALTAAGVVEVVASVLQMSSGFVHPNPQLREPIDDHLRFVSAVGQPAEIGFVLSNSFGFGGFNSTVVLANPLA